MFIADDLASAPVLDPRGSRAGMAREVLHIFERHILIEFTGLNTQRKVRAPRRELAVTRTSGEQGRAVAATWAVERYVLNPDVVRSITDTKPRNR